MKLLRIGEPGREKPAILTDTGDYVDISSIIPDISGDRLEPESLARITAADLSKLPVLSPDSRIGPCVGGVGKFLCIGLNYFGHAKETGLAVPEEPVLFHKATTAISGSNDPIQIPKGSTATDYEVELGIVIGRTAKYVSEENASDYIAGFCVVNDVSERNFQKFRGGQWTKGKSADSFGPIGPWLVTKDEVGDPTSLDLWLEVNGERRQTASTSDLIFKPDFIVHHLSQFMTLAPGDVIATGTPAGIGSAMKPEPKFLAPGDEVVLEITGLGRQCQTVRAYDGS
ncbi:fumarylacetoacetate hydrolase family protein [Celeribacter sp.]|uniref:fumarylacetoacetate hydrolase family protein n=1 Tax=Celeribacter sp. TaxID=1890673 RepID=UPI003A923991